MMVLTIFDIETEPVYGVPHGKKKETLLGYRYEILFQDTVLYQYPASRYSGFSNPFFISEEQAVEAAEAYVKGVLVRLFSDGFADYEHSHTVC